MATFQPPTVDDVPRTLPDTQGPAYSLFRHYAPLTRGLSVLKNHDGSYTTLTMPTGEQIEAAVFAYIGGHIYEVSNAEAAALLAAGFTVGSPEVPPGGPYTWATIPGTWAEQTATWAAI